jgi:hypothetical protein
MLEKYGEGESFKMFKKQLIKSHFVTILHSEMKCAADISLLVLGLAKGRNLKFLRALDSVPKIRVGSYLTLGVVANHCGLHYNSELSLFSF